MFQKSPPDPAKSSGLAVLIGLNRTGKHVYGGTVPEAEVEHRRVKNKAARRARRLNRRSR